MQKNKLREEYWNAIGNKEVGYFTRKDLIKALAYGAVPIIGTIIFIISFPLFLIASRNKEKVPEKYRHPEK